jgi:hypothetical protein
LTTNNPKMMSMKTQFPRRLAGALLLPALAATAAATPALGAQAPVEGYRSPDGHVGCVLLQDYNKAGNAVTCGTRDGVRGVLVPSSGRARATSWRWPATTLGESFLTATWNRTLFLTGGTAKLTGSATTLRCAFTRPTTVTCLNRTGHGLVVTPEHIATVAPLT